jgi:hypothetical protein
MIGVAFMNSDVSGIARKEVSGDGAEVPRNPRLLEWLLSVWLGTVIGGGMFGGIIVIQAPQAFPLFFAVGCMWAAVGSLPILAVAGVVGLALRSAMDSSVVRIVMAAVCGFTSGVVSALQIGPMAVAAGAVGAIGAMAGVLLADRRWRRRLAAVDA